MSEKIDVDVLDLNRRMCRALSLFATTGKLPRENEQGVEVLVGKNRAEGNIKYRLATYDDQLVEIVLEVPQLIRQGRPYLENLLEEVRDKLEDERHRSVDKAIHILTR